jgi:hypothetical protein
MDRICVAVWMADPSWAVLELYLQRMLQLSSIASDGCGTIIIVAMAMHWNSGRSRTKLCERWNGVVKDWTSSLKAAGYSIDEYL